MNAQNESHYFCLLPQLSENNNSVSHNNETFHNYNLVFHIDRNSHNDDLAYHNEKHSYNNFSIIMYYDDFP